MALRIVAVQLGALAAHTAGITRAGHVEQQVVGVRVPPHVLHLAVVVAGHLPQVDGVEWLLILVVNLDDELVVGTAGRAAVEGEPADVDAFGDELLKVLGLLATRQVFVLILFAQPVDGAVGLVLQRNHVPLPVCTIILY